MPSKASKFLKGVGRSIRSGADNMVHQAGGAIGKVAGGAVGAGIVQYAPLALAAFKTGALLKHPRESQ